MARITVEDCLERVANRFELIMLATKRSRDLMRGKSDTDLDWENDKATVVALREIAEGKITVDYLKEDAKVDESASVLIPTVPVHDDDAG